jgi:L-asparaginase II
MINRSRKPAPENPILVEVTREPVVESWHRGRACVVGPGGDVVEAWGDVDAPILPRSAVKPLQVLPFLETGAAEAVRADDRQVALACASHGGEKIHLDVAEPWLSWLGLREDDLACGPHEPADPAAAAALVREGATPRRLHNNCSGKHLAMLSTAVYLGEPTRGYAQAIHPVQRRIRERLSEVTDFDLTAAPTATDGCNVPTFAMPLTALARGFAWLATEMAPAPTRIRVATAANPLLVGGTERFDSHILSALGASVLTKGGAEGVHAAAVPALGVGIALKIDDGNRRASEVAMAALLRYLKVIDDDAWEAMAADARPTIQNTAGVPVGTIRTAGGWLDS